MSRGIITNQTLLDLCRTLRAWDEEYDLTPDEVREIAELLPAEYEATKEQAE